MNKEQAKQIELINRDKRAGTHLIIQATVRDEVTKKFYSKPNVDKVFQTKHWNQQIIDKAVELSQLDDTDFAVLLIESKRTIAKREMAKLNKFHKAK
ncbi:hypothetical protein UFOVP1596_31 [uncultured Caudovirales phage]|uniref:Uncharacterized protein n=1 Tax=uncultured Caudovirales phage TaxID=2100421 RepID=A0A6J5SU55_9CAUD|nr:hypothetical protein UFOVP1596_31 [uncultured Caudovirales phage]